jgi:hypothetical protein
MGACRDTGTKATSSWACCQTSLSACVVVHRPCGRMTMHAVCVSHEDEHHDWKSVFQTVLQQTTNNHVRRCSPLARWMCALLCLVAGTLAVDFTACTSIVAVASLHVSPCLCLAIVKQLHIYLYTIARFFPNCVITRVIKPRHTATLHPCVHVRPHVDRVSNALWDLCPGGPCFSAHSPSPPSPTHLPSTPLPPAPPSLSSHFWPLSPLSPLNYLSS